MADLPSSPSSNRTDDSITQTNPGRDVDAGTPRWVIVFGVVALVVIVLVVALHLAGLAPGGMMNHGMPQR